MLATLGVQWIKGSIARLEQDAQIYSRQIYYRLLLLKSQAQLEFYDE